MPTAPVYENLKLICCGEKRARTDGKLTRRHARPVVHSIDLLHIPAVHNAVFAHFAAAAAALFCGLENHDHGAVEISRLGQILRRPQKHRGMPIVPAGVHRAFGL